MTAAAVTDPPLINIHEGEVAFAREYSSRIRGSDVNRHNRFRVKIPGESKERDVSLEIAEKHALAFHRGDKVILIYIRKENGEDGDLMAVYNKTVDGYWASMNPAPMFFWAMVIAAVLAYLYADHWGWYAPAVVLGVVWLGGGIPARDAALEHIGKVRQELGLWSPEKEDA